MRRKVEGASNERAGVLTRCQYTYQVWQLQATKRGRWTGTSAVQRLVSRVGHPGIAVLEACEAKLRIPDSYVHVQRWQNAHMELGPQTVWDSIRGNCKTDLSRDVVRVLREG